MTIPETRIFRSIDKTVHADPDYWPTFQLQSVKVVPHGKAKSKYARCVSLFEASVDNPLCLVGQLEQVDEADLDRVLDEYQDSHDALSLTIPHVTNFCYGEQDRVCKLWVEGQAGWFEIQPAIPYRHIYMTMTEAVGAWYYLEDQHNISGARKSRNPDVDTLFEVYLKKHRGYETVEMVESIFHASQHFLISQMKKQDADNEDFDTRMKWADTNIYQYFVEQSSDEDFDDSEATLSEDDLVDLGESDDESSEPPHKNLKAGKSTKSAILRPTGLTPKNARHKSARNRTALPMSLNSDDISVNGQETRMGLVGEMKKAGASTSFLEAFLEDRHDGTQ